MPRKPKEETSLQRARKAHAERMRAQGCKPKTFWITPEGAEALVKLGLRYPTDNESALINAALGFAAEAFDEAEALDKAPQTPAHPVSTPKPTKTPAKTVKAVRGDAEAVVGAKLDTSAVAVHPSLQKGKK